MLCGTAVLCRRALGRIEGAELIWRAVVLLPVMSATATQFAGGLWTIGISEAAGLAMPSAAAQSTLRLSSGIDIPPVLIAAWLLVGATLVIRDWLAHRLFVRRLGTRRPADARLVAAVSDLLQHARVRRAIRVTCSESVVSPIALGRSEICLPVRAIRVLSRRQLRALIAHEVAHIVRCDGRWFAALACVESALFVQPLNRMARRELHHLAETMCDQWAARELSDPTAMAHCLVEIAAWSRTARPATVLGVAGMSGLSDRVRRLLDAPHPPPRVSRPLSLAAVVALSLSLPCLGVSPARPARGASVNGVPQSPAAAPALAQPSAEFIRGFEAGRRFAEGQPDARVQASLDRGRAASPARQEWRAEVERHLQARERGRHRPATSFAR